MGLMNRKLVLLMSLGLTYFSLRREQARKRKNAEEPGRNQGQEQPMTGQTPCQQGQWQRREEAEIRKVNRFYEAIAREREKRIPPGSRLKRDRWGFLYEKNPNGLGWREFGADPDEPYTLKANSSWC